MRESAAAGLQNPAALECRFCGAECPPELEEMPCQNCKADTYFRFIPPGTPRNYREIVDSLGMRDKHIAAAFGYKNLGAFTSSSAAAAMKAGIEFVYYATVFSRG